LHSGRIAQNKYVRACIIVSFKYFGVFLGHVPFKPVGSPPVLGKRKTILRILGFEQVYLSVFFGILEHMNAQLIVDGERSASDCHFGGHGHAG
jgi:hypothetical protein